MLLDQDDIGRLKYMNTKEFRALTGTRLFSVGALNYKNNSKTAKKVDGILKKINLGIDVPEELVLVEGPSNDFVIIEGNHRATAFVLAKKARTSAFIGKSPKMHLWGLI